MYRIIATQDFMDLLEELPIKYLAVLTSSFVKIEKCEEVNLEYENNSFINDLFEQIRNEELE